jgi:RNA polymerase sigma-70 factor (ECF subfamily)
MTAEEFDAFYAGTVGRLVGQLYAMTGDLTEAQDVVQEAFIRAWQRRQSLSMIGSPEAWVRTVAWRLAVSRWRRTRRSVTRWREESHDTVVNAPSTDHVALVDALRRIPEAQRIAIVLHHLCDRSIEQIAEETGSPVGTVKARLFRGRAALAPFLHETEPTEVSGA